METQDHKKPKQQGYEGHSGGVHLCGRCGWPYPKPHPSSKHRRAHKKICGTIEGYKLDIDAQNKNQSMDGSDGENASDDEHKAPSDKVVERAISRRSSSGVGSRSNRSEDDMFSDAVTDFTDCPSPADASDGGIQRFYSMQRVTVNDMNNAKQSAEDASTGEDASVVRTADEAIRGPHSAGETTKLTAMESTDSESNIESSAVEAISGPHSAGEATKSTAMESTNSESNIESSVAEAITGPQSVGEISRSMAMESTDPESNIERSQIVAGPGISPSLEHPAGVIDPANGSTSKSSDVMEDHGSNTGANEDVYVLAVLDGLPLHKHDIAVEDLDHKRGKINTLKVPDSAMETASVECGTVHAAEEVSSGNSLTETGDNEKVCSEDVHVSADVMENKLNQDVEQKSIVEEIVVGEPAQISDIIEASDSDINNSRSEVVTDYETEHVEDKKISFSEEEKATASLESVYPEGVCTDAADNQEFSSHGAANTSNNVKYNTQHVILQDFDESEVLGKELYGYSVLAEGAISDTPPQVIEISDINDSNGTYNDGNIGVVQTVLDGNEMKTGGEYSEAVKDESAPGYGSSTAKSHDGIREPLEPERILDHDKLDQSDVVVGHSLPMVDSSTSGNSGGAECASEDSLGAILKSDDFSGSKSKMIPGDTLEACEDAQHPLQTSDDVNATCTEKFPEEASGAIESNVSIKKHVAVSANDVLPDSSSQTDSLEGNWGSVSVLSAISETPTVSDTPASNYSLASAAEENASLELKPAVEGQQSESKTSVDAQVGIEKEGASEIETLEEQQQKGSALQTAWSSSAAHADNAPHAGKKNDEIIAKVTNWNADKNHTPLKTLLGEATAKSRAESPIHTQVKSQTDEFPVAKNGFPKTEYETLSSDNPTFEPSKDEMGKEWNSPARYPVNIKTEKKAKSRPYWAPFLCCSSVNAR